MASALTFLGIVLAWVASRLVPPDDAVPTHVGAAIRRSALVGGVLGAYLGELPARLLGVSAAGDHAPLVGRTVLGGLLVGWLAVEWTKWRLGHRAPTGDRFALPLAIGLCIGRLGCLLGGCCRGRLVEADTLAGRLGMVLYGEPRYPAPLVEAYAHGIAAVLLVVAHVRGFVPGARLALYVALYAALRFALETVREAPPMALGLTYYQLLAFALFMLAGVTFVRRVLPRRLTPASRGPTSGS